MERGANNSNTRSVPEIKGTPSACWAHFRRQVHGFRRCAPGVCTILSFIILHIRRVHGEIPGRTVLGEERPVSAQNETLLLITECLCNIFIVLLFVQFVQLNLRIGVLRRFFYSTFAGLG